MTTIKAEMIKDSVSSEGIRLSTMKLRFPLSYLAQLNTHRMMSKNTASSRAIPSVQIIKMIEDEPVHPIKWTKNQKGMQGGAELSPEEEAAAIAIWDRHRQQTVEAMQQLLALGLHKQYANRLATPHQHVNVLVTATNWENFLHLRDHSDAQPEMELLAKEIRRVRSESVPKFIGIGCWHMPFIEVSDWLDIFDYLNIESSFSNLSNSDRAEATKLALKISAARCARLSYQAFDGRATTIQEDLALVEKLMGTHIHASPFEHQATPDRREVIADISGPAVQHYTGDWETPQWHGNLEGWIQYRKTIDGEYTPEPEYEKKS